MQINSQSRLRRGYGYLAFTLIESVVAMAIVGVAFMALYSGMTSGVLMIRTSREDLRVTQIMLEKMEFIRLCTWDQINAASFIPTTFTASYDLTATNSAAKSRLQYVGRITITQDSSLTEAYRDDLRLVTVEITWSANGGDRKQTRTMSTYISRYGIQNYVIN